VPSGENREEEDGPVLAPHQLWAAPVRFTVDCELISRGTDEADAPRRVLS
jgi:hypothetical protein